MFFKKNYTEKELVEGCVKNDRRCQEALYRKFYDSMYHLCLRHAKSDDRAMEMLNKGFLRVFQKIETFSFQGSLEGWIRKIVYHAVADYYRENARYANFLVFDDSELESVELNKHTLYEDDLYKQIETLPATSAKVFKLYAIEGFSHAEIAESLQMSEGNSKWHLHQARQRLKDLINLGNNEQKIQHT